jgi:hypothetical protein
MKKNHILLWIFIVGFSIHAFAQSTINIESKPGWKTLQGDRYTIEYPADWDLDQSGKMGTQFLILAPLTEAKDQFRENVNLHIQDLTGQNLDMDRYVSLSENQITTLMANGHILESSRHNHKDHEYHKMSYSGNHGTYKLQFLQYYWIINQKAYILTLTCEHQEFEEYKTTGEQMVNSFILF